MARQKKWHVSFPCSFDIKTTSHFISHLSDILLWQLPFSINWTHKIFSQWRLIYKTLFSLQFYSNTWQKCTFLLLDNQFMWLSDWYVAVRTVKPEYNMKPLHFCTILPQNHVIRRFAARKHTPMLLWEGRMHQVGHSSQAAYLFPQSRFPPQKNRLMNYEYIC